MTDFVQLQNDLTHALLSAEALNSVTVVQWRKLRLQAEVDRDALWLTVRNGRSGAGVLVEMPEFRVTKPNLPGPQAEMNLAFSVVEEPNLNFAPEHGTQLSAENICQLILETLHGVRLNGGGGFSLYAAPNAIQPSEEFGPGLIAYRVVLTTVVPRAQTNRVLMPTISVAAGEATLACATAEANIYFTVTPANAPENVATFPGRSNPAAQLYAAPVPVNVGELLRCAAYKTDLIGSDVNAQTIT